MIARFEAADRRRKTIESGRYSRLFASKHRLPLASSVFDRVMEIGMAGKAVGQVTYHTVHGVIPATLLKRTLCAPERAGSRY